jgi:alkaline phosphatase D
MRVDRRRALKLLGVGAVSPAVAAPVVPYSSETPSRFQHGVASGDPTSDSVIIWTRITPQTPDPHAHVAVEWSVAADSEFRRVVARGAADATQVRDFTVKIDVDRGLKPDTDYWYRFRSGGELSPAGRTRTLPDGRMDEAVLAIVSCSCWENGLFNGYAAIAALPRVDAIVHLGDYIYENGQAHCSDHYQAWSQRMNRQTRPEHDLVSLADYRTRHALYKTDPDLQAAHARAPWICVWDDHESANDCWVGGAENHHPGEGRWSDREGAAVRAYYEWMPIREPEPGAPFAAINRSFQFGDLLSLIMVESRLVARAHQVSYVTDAPLKRGPDGLETPDIAALKARLDDPSRQMLGARQEAWLADELKASVAAGRTWQVLSSQVVMGEVIAPNVEAILGPILCKGLMAVLPADDKARAKAMADIFAYRLPYNLDAWDGYPAARERVYQAMRASGARPIVVSGDSHAFWANELHDASGAHVAVEFGGTSLTSPGICDIVPLLPVNQLIEEANPGRVRFTDHAAKGFIRLTLTHGGAIGELMAVSTVEAKPFDVRTLKTYRTVPGPAGGVSALEEIQANGTGL